MKITRRNLCNAALASAGTSILGLDAHGQRRGSEHVAVTVHEITMAAPDIVCVEIRDPPVSKGALLELSSPDGGAYGAWLTRTNPATGLADKCMVVGPNRKHLRFQDIRASAYYNRAAGDVAADWGKIAGLSVTAVFRKTLPYSSGECYGSLGTRTTKAVSMKHFVFLKLSGRLPPGGPYAIAFPPGVRLPAATFSFDDKTTRAIAIRATQHGHRPGDASKLAYLSLWIPGAPGEGAVAFGGDYGLTAFNIIDADGLVVFDPGPRSIAPRVGPATAEPGSATAKTGIKYASTSTPPVDVKHVSQANPAVVTAPGHRLESGQQIYFYNMGGRVNSGRGMTQLNYKLATVTAIDADSFAVDIDTRGFTAFNGGGTIYRVNTANRAGTYVYGLDYSAWKPAKAGHYRVQVPGLGVSDPFYVGEDNWYRGAAVSAQGCYHHYSGVALDGRFGYKRPVCFREGADGMAVALSLMPIIWTGLVNVGIPQDQSLSLDLAGTSPWATPTRLTGIFGGWMDAGDWITLIRGHGMANYDLFDVYQRLEEKFGPDGPQLTHFNVPACREVLDPETWVGTDALPDMLRIAFFNVDFYRRLQRPDGSVPGGWGSGQSGNVFEPSWLFRNRRNGNANQGFILGADHSSTFVYAGVAAKAASVLARAGFPKLSQLYLASAVKAFDWADSLYTGDAAASAYYADVRARAGWSDAQYRANLLVLKNDIARRLFREFAQACLFAAGAGQTFGDGVKAAYASKGDLLYYGGCAYWEYANAPGADPATAARIRRGFTDRADAFIVAYSRGANAYRNLQHLGLGLSWGAGGTGLSDVGAALIRAHLIAPAAKYLDCLQAGEAWIQGANQYGMCWTSGLGVRNTTMSLHDDSRWGSSVTGTPVPSGITNYATADFGFSSFALNFAPGPVNFIVENPNVQFASDFEMERTMSHLRYCFPLFEAIFEIPTMIQQMEYTIPQTIVPQLYVQMYLHGYDGNTVR